MPGGAANALVAGNPGLGPLAKRLMMDPDINEQEALSLIQLPAQTMYLIDKVVRQKSKTGPIGIDNSEVINLEVETEFKLKNNHVLKLNNIDSGMDFEQRQGWVDEEGLYHPVSEDERLFKENERLLQRLTNAVSKGSLKRPGESQEMSYADMTAHTDGIIDISAPGHKALVKELISEHVNDTQRSQGSPSKVGMTEAQQLLALQEAALKISHEQWVRRKDHETLLRQKLIIEAKRDLLETLV